MVITLCIELYKSDCIHRSFVSKIFEINFFGLQKWIFRCSNFMTVSDPLFLFKKFRYIFVTEKIRYLIKLSDKLGSVFTNTYSLIWLQRYVTWHRYYIILLGSDRSHFWKCCNNPVVYFTENFTRNFTENFSENSCIPTHPPSPTLHITHPHPPPTSLNPLRTSNLIFSTIRF